MAVTAPRADLLSSDRETTERPAPLPAFSLDSNRLPLRHCYVNPRVGGMEPRVVQRRRSCCALGACLLAPDFESLRPDRMMGMGYKLMSTRMEVAVDEGMSGEEVLRLFGRFEPLHLPLSSARRPMLSGPLCRPPCGAILPRRGQAISGGIGAASRLGVVG